MNLSSISSTTSTDWSAMRQNLVEKMTKQLDSDGNGSISKAELQQAKDAADKRASGSQVSANSNVPPSNAPTVDQLFQKFDANSDDELSSDELLTFADAIMSGRPQKPGGADGPEGAGGPPPGGPPPGGAAPGAAENSTGEGASTSSSDDSDSDSNAEPADANKDGKVTMAELIAYDLKQLTELTKLATGKSSTPTA